MPAPAGSTATRPPSLRLLIAKLKDIQSSFNDIRRFIANFRSDTSNSNVEIRLEKLDELWERFGNIVVEISIHEDYEESEDLEGDREDFSDKYYEAKSFLVDKLKEREIRTTSEQSFRNPDASMQGTFEHVRLPQIKLQTFTGDIDEWLSFRDLFKSLIHNKTDLPDVEKLHYLKDCLQGEPKSLIDPLQITAGNYRIAWDCLLKKYNNSKQLKKRQIQALMKLPTLTKESPGELHTLVEGLERTIKTLDQIVQPGDYKDLLLINIVTTRLDPVTRRGWEEFSAAKEQETYNDLIDFLQRRVQVLDSLPARVIEGRYQQQTQPQTRQKSVVSKTSLNTVQGSGFRCFVCAGNHYLYQCVTFQKMSVDDREKVLRTHSLCRNCFRKGHRAKNCQSKISCRRCKGRHHTLVCFRTEEDTHSRFGTVSRSPNRNQEIRNQGPSCSASSQSSQVINLSAKKAIAGETISKHSTKVLLATAVVMVRDTNGNQYPARALLDSGSESNFMTERLSQNLRVTRERVNIPVLGIGEVASKVKQRIRATILSRVSGFSREMEFLILPKVTVNLPTTSINTRGWAIPEGIQLADPSFGVPTAVDMVLGIESFFDFFESGTKVGLGDNLPILKETVFGWVVCGGLADSTQVSRVNCNVSTTKNLESLISKFWSCEEINSTNDYSLEEARCEEWFVQSVVRDDDGRYTVSLPMERDALSRLGKSKNIHALRRLQSTERRLTRDASLREEYISFMEEYLRLGHMRKVDGTSRESGKRSFLPHHPVVKESSTTTKVRVVFDASCKTSSGVSLNDVLLTGPVVQEDLRSIILRCRIKQIMLVADVEKMFRQIYIHPEERPLQSILWRASPKEEVCTYELNTVTYGTRPAPFLATRTLKQLATDEREKYPLAYKSIIEDTYMDDVITGSDNVEAAINLSFQLNHIMEDGGFRLRKWASNCEAVLNTIPEENSAIRDTEGINLDPDNYVRTLGLTWIPKMDVFRFQFSVPPIDEYSSITKRQVLSIIASLFDPLGLIGATIVTAKIFMQLLWTLRDNNKHVWSWDQPSPSTVDEAWKRYHKQLPGLNKI
ncbi:uncharacterized protein LOC129773739 [Toxorhynchites rutilus septentrionalis]|uniref:uncharacterized protein LOC129773739 n=1 Tax=Toxorhynchites rutilus septentrionalis TaxID=329112 RepID=UPI00247A985A|nr:uncharacterized protein LOC129773739 [Toxorhynchites rutilus septentrionalis]